MANGIKRQSKPFTKFRLLHVFRTVALGCAGLPIAAHAQTNFEQIPTVWRLQQYGSNGVAAYYTASSCASGQITVPTTYSSEDISRFWATVLTARALGKIMGIYYDGSTSQCYITSYYLKEQ